MEIINLLDDKKEIIYKCQKIMKNKKKKKYVIKGLLNIINWNVNFIVICNKKIELKECIIINNRACQNENVLKNYIYYRKPYVRLLHRSWK